MSENETPNELINSTKYIYTHIHTHTLQQTCLKPELKRRKKRAKSWSHKWNGGMVKHNCKWEWENVIWRMKWIGSAARMNGRYVNVWQGKAATACLKCSHCCLCARNFMAIIKANCHNGLYLQPPILRPPTRIAYSASDMSVCVCVCLVRICIRNSFKSHDSAQI